MDLSGFLDIPAIRIALSLIDVALVAYLLHRALILIRGTRGQQALVGLGLIAFAFLIAKILGLKTISWILDNFTSSLVLLIIVVFQNDIRRGLSRMGRRPFLGNVAYGQGAYLVDELTRSCEAMAKDKIGAIILVERDANLSELAETGIRVDARVSTPLLAQIFTPPGPLHDGAVLIQHGRVSAASVFLPLSQNTRLDQALGTRHRAAVSATEEVDAIAIVVSEERGQVSVAEGGQLTRDLDGPMLRRVLANYLTAGNTTKSTLKTPAAMAAEKKS